jgi:hypothetical protein
LRLLEDPDPRDGCADLNYEHLTLGGPVRGGIYLVVGGLHVV